MGCLRLTYEEDESPLRVSREPESDTVIWQVWVAETPAKKVKEVEDQSNGGVNPVNLGLSNSGELLLYNLRKIYSDYQSNGSADRERYELSDAVNILTKFSGAVDRGGMGSSSSGLRTISGVDVRITVLQYQDNNGGYLSGGPNQFTGLKPNFKDPIVFSNRIVFSMQIDPSITFSITSPRNQGAINAAQSHLNNIARFIYGRTTPGFNLSTPNPYGN